MEQVGLLLGAVDGGLQLQQLFGGFGSCLQSGDEDRTDLVVL
jgi:hypothetical protein